MVSNNKVESENFYVFRKMIPWSNPLVYVALVVAAILYVVIFYVIPEQPGQSFAYRSREQMILCVLLSVSFVWIIHEKTGGLLRKQDSTFGVVGTAVALVLLAAFTVNILFLRIDFADGRIRTTSNLSPVINKIFSKFYYDISVEDIEKVVYHNGGDSGNSIRFTMKDGTRRGIASNVFPLHAFRTLLRYIGEENHALQGMLTEDFGVDFTKPARVYQQRPFGFDFTKTMRFYQKKPFRLNPDLLSAIWHTWSLWMILLQLGALLGIGKLTNKSV